MLKLKTEARKSGAARVAGLIPAVIYGPKIESISISVPEKELSKLWKEAGESTVITLETETGNQDVLINEIARDPVSDTIIHADFYAVDKNKKVGVEVPLEFVGVAPAVKEFGGVIMKIAHEIGIEALPKDLPHAIEVDLSSLTALEDHITAGDIKLPPGVTLTASAEEIIAIVTAAKEETEEASATEIDMSAIELSEKKGKKEDEDAASE